jgi:hypothetical protein
MEALEERTRVKRQSSGCQLDLVFVVDSSGSIQFASNANWGIIKDFMVDIVSRLTIGTSDTQIGVVLFSNNAENVFYLNSFSNGGDVTNAIQQLPYLDGSTNTQAGILKMLSEQFVVSRGDRSGAQNVAIVITDGESTVNPENTIPAAMQARNADVSIFSIGIGDRINEAELRLMSSVPQARDTNYFLSPTFDALSSISSAIATGACNTAAPSCAKEVDIALIIDASNNIQNSQVDFPAQLQVAKDFVSYLDLSRVRISVVKFSQFANVEFRLDSFQSGQLSNIYAAIDNVAFSNQGANIADAFAIVRNQVFQASAGDRSSAPNVVLLMTFGPASVNTANLEVEANAAKAAGIKIVPIGISSRVDSGQLQRIASNTNEVFLANSVADISAIRSQIVAATCPNAPAPTPPPVVSDNFYCRWYADALGLEHDGVECFCRHGQCDNRPTNGTQCQDINECLENNGGCEQSCSNTDGSFKCSCRSGFNLASDGRYCEDVNECLTPNACGSESAVKCVNTHGSYACLIGVQPGFAGQVGLAPAVISQAAVGTTTTTTAVIAAIAISALNLIVIVGVALKYYKNKRAAASSDNKPSSVQVEGHANKGFTNTAGTARSFASIQSKFGSTDSIDSMTVDTA